MTGWAIYDEIKEKLFVFTNLNVSGQCTCDVGFVTSSDGGLSWTDLAPVNTDTSVDNGGFFGMGLTHGITHSSGRLVGCQRKICRNSCPAGNFGTHTITPKTGTTTVHHQRHHTSVTYQLYIHTSIPPRLPLQELFQR